MLPTDYICACRCKLVCIQFTRAETTQCYSNTPALSGMRLPTTFTRYCFTRLQVNYTARSSIFVYRRLNYFNITDVKIINIFIFLLWNDLICGDVNFSLGDDSIFKPFLNHFILLFSTYLSVTFIPLSSHSESLINFLIKSTYVVINSRLLFHSH